MYAWPGEELYLSKSDRVIASEVCSKDKALESKNRLAVSGQFENVWTGADALCGPRWGPAPCGMLPTGASDATLRRLVPNGFLLQTCPAATFSNQIVYDHTRVCSASHQTFLNTTKRGTGAVHATWHQ
jgi:hypothetical protein